MNLAIWIAITAGLIAAAAPITGGHRSRINEKQFAKLPRKHGLPLPQGLRGAVLARVNPRERTALKGGWIGLGVGAVTGLGVQVASRSDAFSGVFVMLGAGLGMSLGSYVGVRRTALTLLPDAPRVARSRATGLEDYVTAAERWAVRLVPVTVGITVAAMWAIWALAPVKPAGGVLGPVLGTLVAVAVIGVWALLTRARAGLVDAPQHAHDDLELAWDDALRSAAIRDVQDTGISLGMLTTFGLLVMTVSWLIQPDVRTGAEPGTIPLGLTAFATFVFCWALLLIPWGIGRARRNPSLALWPTSFGAA